MTDRELIDRARRARKYAHAPYSKLSVGAALLTKNGKVVTGSNVENSSYGLSCCAERVALFKAVSEGETEFVKIAIVGPDDIPFFPCGACRQVLFEFAPDITVIILDKQDINRYSLRELLPHGFGLQEKRTK
ncbi:MAG: cytidine deaminase [Candidatus Cloacimonadota bacterium]|nr:MAG: cytidine deaminase [Candidatus Cloacimonadota bacterium]